ncbi:hypothetical protein KR093_001700 [Drosophila rubida]|uniref:FHA domain-containing protein n=1 Tax=Drosophila rubida TaxID=30044 RepID=A0AAD4PH71_9MUSC|nr:hypothetical protein KR093_001700 [Drosophila rubida]
MSLDGAQLSFVNADGISVAHAAKGRKFNVGSYLGCDLVLPDAERVHCEIQCDAFGRVTIYNHSCTAPIELNDQVLHATAKRPLLHGARIKILDEVYTWNFPRADDVSTPERAPPEPASNSSPSLKVSTTPKSILLLTFNTCSFRYSINSDDEGNTSIESRELEASSAEIAKQEPEPTERSITPPAKDADEPLPKVDLLEATQNKENTSTLGNKLMLQLCARSDVVITSFSPRETGVKIEKSFTCVLKPTGCVGVSSAASTPKSVYNTPKSVLSELNEDSCSRDLLEYSTPSTSKKAQAGKRPTSMYLIDLTTPQKLRPTLSVTPKQTPSSVGVISVDSTDMSSDDSPIVIDITNSSTPSTTPSKQQQMRVLKTPKDQLLAAGATPKRTPQSLMKRALLTSAKKQIAQSTKTPTTPQARTNRQSLLDARRQCLTAPRRLPFHPQPQWRTPGRRQLPALTTKGPQTSPRKRQSMSLNSPRDTKISMLRKTLAANAKLSPTIGMSNKLVARARRSLNSPKAESPKRMASPKVTANESIAQDTAHDSTRELSLTFTIDDDDEQNATAAALKALMADEVAASDSIKLQSSKEQSNLLDDEDIKAAIGETSAGCSTRNDTSREETLNITFELNVSATSRDATIPTADASIKEQLSSSTPEIVKQNCDDDVEQEDINKSIPNFATKDVDKSRNSLDADDVIEDSICEEVPTTQTYQEGESLYSISFQKLDEVAPPGRTPMPRRSSQRLSTDQNTMGLTPRRSLRRASIDATKKLEKCLKPTRRASCSAADEIQTTAVLATPKRKRRLTEELSTPTRKSHRLLCVTPKRAVQVDESVGDMGVIIEEDAGNADVLPIVADEDYGTELPTNDADEPDKIDYHGMREMLKTPKSCSTPHFKGLREMVRTPKVYASPMLGNIEEMLETPSTPKRSVTVSRVTLKLSKAEAIGDAQDMYFKTPRGKNLMIPNDPASAVLKTNKSLATTTEYDLNATNATLHLDKIFDDVLAAETTDPSIAVENSEHEINVTAISTAAVSEADPLSTTAATNSESNDTARSEALMNICYADNSHKDPLTSTAFKDGGKTDLNESEHKDESYVDRAKSPDICDMSGIQMLDQTTDSMFSEPLVVTGVESCDVTLEESKATGNNLPEKKDILEEDSDTDSMVGLSEPLVLSDDEDIAEERTKPNEDQIKESKDNDSIVPPAEIKISNAANELVVDKKVPQTSTIYAAELSQASSNIQVEDTDKDESASEGALQIEQKSENVSAILTGEDNNEELNSSTFTEEAVDSIQSIQLEQEVKATDSVEQITNQSMQEAAESMGQIEENKTTENASIRDEASELTFESADDSLFNDTNEVNRSNIGLNKTADPFDKDERIDFEPSVDAGVNRPSNELQNDITPIEKSSELPEDKESTELPVKEALVGGQDELSNDEIEDLNATDTAEISVASNIKPIIETSMADMDEKSATSDKNTLDKNETDESATSSEEVPQPIADLPPSEQLLDESAKEAEDGSKAVHESLVSVPHSEKIPSETKEPADDEKDTIQSKIELDASVLDEKDKALSHVPDVEDISQTDLDATNEESLVEKNMSIIDESENTNEHMQAAKKLSISSVNLTNETSAYIEEPSADKSTTKPLNEQVQEVESSSNQVDAQSEIQNDLECSTNADESLISMDTSAFAELDSKEEEHIEKTAAETSKTPDNPDEIKSTLVALEAEIMTDCVDQEAVEIASSLAEKSTTEPTLVESAFDLDKEQSIVKKASETSSKLAERSSNDPDKCEALDDTESNVLDNSVVNLDGSVDEMHDGLTPSTSTEKSPNKSIGNETRADLETTNADESLVDLDSPPVADFEEAQSVSDVQEILSTTVEDAIVDEIGKEEADSDGAEILPIAAKESVVNEIGNKVVSDALDVLSTTAKEAVVTKIDIPEILSTTSDAASNQILAENEDEMVVETTTEGDVSIGMDATVVDSFTTDKEASLMESPLISQDLSKEDGVVESITPEELAATNENQEIHENVSNEAAQTSDNIDEQLSQTNDVTEEVLVTNLEESISDISMTTEHKLCEEKSIIALESTNDQNNVSKIVEKSSEKDIPAIDSNMSYTSNLQTATDAPAREESKASGVINELNVSKESQHAEDIVHQPEVKAAESAQMGTKLVEEADIFFEELSSEPQEGESTPTGEVAVEILDSDEEDEKCMETTDNDSENTALVEEPIESTEPESESKQIGQLAVEIATVSSESLENDEKIQSTSPKSISCVDSAVEIIDNDVETQESEETSAENADNNLSQVIESSSTIIPSPLDTESKQSVELSEDIVSDSDDSEQYKAVLQGSTSQSAQSINDEKKDDPKSVPVIEPTVEIIDSDGDASNQAEKTIGDAGKNTPLSIESHVAIDEQNLLEDNGTQETSNTIGVSSKPEIEAEVTQVDAPAVRLIPSNNDNAILAENKIHAMSQKSEQMVIEISSSDEESSTDAISQEVTKNSLNVVAREIVNQVSHENNFSEADSKSKSVCKETLTVQHLVTTENSSDIIMEQKPKNLLGRRRRSSVLQESNIEMPKLIRRKSVAQDIKIDVNTDDEPTTSQSDKLGILTDKPKRRARRSTTDVIETDVRVEDKLRRKPSADVTKDELQAQVDETVDVDKPKRRGRKPSVIEEHPVSEVDDEVADQIEVKQGGRKPIQSNHVEQSANLEKLNQNEVEKAVQLAESSAEAEIEFQSGHKERGRKPEKHVGNKALSLTDVIDVELEIENKVQHDKIVNLEKPKYRERKPSVEVETADGDKPKRRTRKSSSEIVEAAEYVVEETPETTHLDKPKKRVRKPSAEVSEASVHVEEMKDEHKRGRRASVDVANASEISVEVIKENPRRRNRKGSEEVTDAVQPVHVPEKKPVRNTRKASAETVESDKMSKEHLPVIVEAIEPDHKQLMLTKPTEPDIVEATPREKSVTRRGRKSTVDEEPLAEVVEASTSREKSATRRDRKATVDEDVPSVQVVEAAELKPKRRARKASADVVHAEAQTVEPTEKSARRVRGASADVAAETETAVEKKTTRRGRNPSASVDIIVEEAPQPKKTAVRRGRKASLSAAAEETGKQEATIEHATVVSAVISPKLQVLSSEDELTPRRREGRNLPRKNYDETSDEDKPGSSRKARKPVASKAVAAAASPLPKPATPTKQKPSVETAEEPAAITQTPINTITAADVTSSQKREGRNMPRKNYTETSDDEKPVSSRGRRIRQPTIKALELLVDTASRPATPKRRGKAKAADAAPGDDAETDEPPEKKIIMDDSTPVPVKAVKAEPAKRGANSRKETAANQSDEPDMEVEAKQPAKRNARGGTARKAKIVEDAVDEQPPVKKARGGARAKTPVVVEAVMVAEVEENKEVPATKRATAARGRNARVAKVIDEGEAVVETPPSRTGRGRKVHFEPMEDSVSAAALAKEAPEPVADEAPKRATRSRRK